MWSSKRPEIRLFRNNVGLAYTKDGTPVRYGLSNGSPDLVGWRRRTVNLTEGYLEIAQFLGIEVKSADGKQSAEQAAFQRVVESMGGLYVLARSVADVEAALQ